MITVIGAGPAGCEAAYHLARRGHKVRIYESKSKIGLPIQCTGILTKNIEKIIGSNDEYTVNKVGTARIHAPNGNSITLGLKRENIVVDRTQFDRFLAEKAEAAGAKIFLRHKFKGFADGQIIINQKTIRTNCLIGADGPRSSVAKASGLYSERKFMIGSQARIRTKCDSDLVEFWLGHGSFAWLVPESDKTARIGIASYTSPNTELRKLIKEKARQSKILGFQGGLIPIYNPNQKIQRKNILLIGDAATQVKATTGGGIIHGLIAAQQLSKPIRNYEKNCRKHVNKDLKMSLLMRKAMDRFSKEEYNELIEMFSKESLRQVIENNDRDFPTKFATTLILKEPRLIKFATKAIF